MALGGDALDLPRPFGPYVLLRRLAVGGMAEVYVAKARGIGGFEKLVAIKVIHPRFSEDEHFITMLVEEAKISVLLQHVNIAQIFDLGCIEDTYFIVMEYIEGADAYRMMKRASDHKLELPLDVCAFVAAEMCQGLDHAHRKRDADGRPLKIVHRDISPQNVLVSHAGEVKLVDFGIAKAALRSGQTEAGVIKGKYYYMSPEQAWGDPMDHRSDVFSTGVVLYELLTGQMLYQEDNVPLLLDRVRKADIPPPTVRRREIPKPLSDIAMRALQRKPEDRFQSAHEMGQALTQFLYRESPSFTASRVADLMGRLFPEEARRHSGITRLPSVDRAPPPVLAPETNDALPAMGANEFNPDRTKSVIFDLGDADHDDATRNDVLPYRRKIMPPAQAAPAAPAPPAARPATPAAQRSAGRSADDQTAEISPKLVQRAAAAAAARSAAPQSGQKTNPVQRSLSDTNDDETMIKGRPRVASQWEDEETLVGGSRETSGPRSFDEDAEDEGVWDDATVVDGDGKMGDRLRDAAAAAGLIPPRGNGVAGAGARGQAAAPAARAQPVAPPQRPGPPQSTPQPRGAPQQRTSSSQSIPQQPQPAPWPPVAQPQRPGPPQSTPQPQARPPQSGQQWQAAAPQPAQPWPAGPSGPPPAQSWPPQPARSGAPPAPVSVNAPARSQQPPPAPPQGAGPFGAQRLPQAYQDAAGPPPPPPRSPANAAVQYADQRPAAPQRASWPPPAIPPTPTPGTNLPWESSAQKTSPLPLAHDIPEALTVPLHDAFRDGADPFAPPVTTTDQIRASEVRPIAPRKWLLLLIPFAIVTAILVGVGTCAVAPDAPPPSVEVVTVPTGASVALDGAPVAGVTPVRISDGLRLGQTQRLDVRLEGYEPWSTSFQAAPGSVQQVVVLTPLRAVLHVETDPPGGQVWVDGSIRGSAPVDIPGLPIGRDVEVRATMLGRTDVVQRIPITSSDLRPQLRLILPPAPR